MENAFRFTNIGFFVAVFRLAKLIQIVNALVKEQDRHHSLKKLLLIVL
jgi:hypothetical protein